MDNEEMARQIAKSAQAFADPIDFERLIRDGLLIKRGRSFYVPDLNALPENISKRIKVATPTKDGLMVTFYKESKSLKKLAESLKDYLE